MTISLIGFGALLLIAFIGFPLGFTMMLIGFVGFGLVRGWVPSVEMVIQQIIDMALNYNFSVLPLFLLMGVFVYKAALAEDLYEATRALPI